MRNTFKLLCCIAIANIFAALSGSANAQTWNVVGVPMFSLNEADYTSIAIDGSGTPYIAYQDVPNADKVTVMKFNGSSWTPVGTVGFSAGYSIYESIAIDGSGTPYVAYQDGAYSDKTTVMKYNGTSWVNVGSPGFSTGTAQYTSIAIDGSGTPYVVYCDEGLLTPGNVVVMKYNGSSWVTVGTAGFSAGSAQYTTIAINSSGTPYVAYEDFSYGNEAVVMKYNGSIWVNVGTPPLSASYAPYTSIKIDGSGTPYLGFEDNANSNKATVLKYNGSSWVTVGSTGFSAGTADNISMAINSSGTPYIGYRDYAYSGQSTVMKYNGSSWVTVGSPGFSTAVYSSSSLALDGSGIPYVAYNDASTINDKATVMRFAPIITGATAICRGSTTTLTDVTGIGTWSSSNTAVGTVGSTGIVTGIAAGTTVISYTVGSGSDVTTITVNPSPDVISAPLSVVCQGSTIAFNDDTLSGGWLCSNTAVAGIGYTTGVVEGISAGTATITYTLSTGCYVTNTVTVLAAPAVITGAATIVCPGSNIALSEVTSGGTWASSNNAIGTVSTSGMVSGISAGNIFVSYTLSDGCNALSLVTVGAPIISTIAGGGGSYVEGGPATSARLNQPTCVVSDASGNIFFTDNLANCVRKISTAGYITTVAGNGTAGWTGDGGPATNAELNDPMGICFDAAGNMYIADELNNRVRKVTASGTISTIAGSTTVFGYSGDGGPATLAKMSYPTQVAVDVAGNVFVTDNHNYCVRMINPGGYISTAAGIPTVSGSSGDGGPATAAKLYGPAGICIDKAGNIYIGDESNTDVRVFNPSKGDIISVFAGQSGLYGYSGDNGPATAAKFYGPAYMSVDMAGNVYVGDDGNNVIRKINTSNIISTIAGNGTGAFGGDGGPPTAAKLWQPTDACVDAFGNVIISDYQNDRVRKITPANVTVSAISGPAVVCQGSIITLTNTTSGGVWTSGNTAVLTVGTGTGIVTGVAGGTATVSYAIANSCGSSYATQSVTVNPLPVVAAISGPAVVCPGYSVTLTDATAGGTWSSSNTSVGTIASGVVAGVLSGATLISYSVTNGCGTVAVIQLVNVNSFLPPISITPATTAAVCLGSSAAFTATVSDTVLSQNFNGALTGWTIANTMVAPATVAKDEWMPEPDGYHNTDENYTYHSNDNSQFYIANSDSAGGGVTTSVLSSPIFSLAGLSSAQLDFYQFYLEYPTDTSVLVQISTDGGVSWSTLVNQFPTLGGGTGDVTVGASGAFAHTTVSLDPYAGSSNCMVRFYYYSQYGWTWAIDNLSISGTQAFTWTGISGATGLSCSACAANTITPTATGANVYSVTATTAGCSETAGVTITVNPLPSVITGPSGVCTGSTIPLGDVSGPGTWSSSNVADATVGSSSGIVSGILQGTATITFTLSTGCLATKVETVSAAPLPVTGTASVCAGSSSLLNDASLGGTWASSNAAVGSVSAGGTLTGVGAGTAMVTYTLSSGCYSTLAFTVNPVPGTITGTPTVCAGATTLLSDATPGGGWTTSNGAVATVVSGTVTGASAGTATITYTLSAGCIATTTVTVYADPVITGANNVCVGGTTTLTGSPGPGVWASSNSAVSSVSFGGVVTGAGAGTATITYTLLSAGGCKSTLAFTVNPLPAAITGAGSVCVGATTLLSDGSPGGGWSTGNAAVATVSSGTVTGAGAGTAAITYTLPTGCITKTFVTVNVTPAITGSNNVCMGGTTPLTGNPAGGLWGSSNTAIGIVSLGGVLSGVGPGTATVAYTISSTGCYSTLAFTVNPLPAAITGTTTVCTGATTLLSDGTPGGGWSSSNGAVATVSSGMVTGAGAGTATITYTLGTGCTATAQVTVNASPAAITPTGAVNICPGATSTLGDATPLGVWSGSNTAIGTVSGGAVTGIAAGTVTISYTLASGCAALKTVTVNIPPAPVSGTGSPVCIGAVEDLTDGITGGTWASSNTGVATVGMSSGMVTGAGTGTAVITYTVNTCTTTSSVTVIGLLSAGSISGADNVCTGSTINLTDAAPGGSWSSSNAVIASVGASSGVVSGVNPGTAIISYSVTNTCGTAAATATITVSSATYAGAIIGSSLMCAGSFTSYTDAVPGGVWSTSNATAMIGTTGLLTAITPGTNIVSYTVSNSCGSASATQTITIGTYLSGGTITGGPSSECIGSSVITLADIAPGGIWSAGNANATVSGGVVTGVSGGVDTISYTLSSSCGSASAIYPVTIIAPPVAGSISGPASICLGGPVTYTDAVTGGAWNVANASASVSGGMVTPLTVGTNILSYTVTNSCGVATATTTINIGAFLSAGSISGSSVVCAGSSIVLTDGTAGGVWSASNTSAVATGGMVTGIAPGIDTISYTVTAACGSVSAIQVITVNPLPVAGSVTGAASLCTGTTATYTDGATGGAWGVSNPSASISSGGLLTPLAAGTDTVIYAVTNSCGTATATAVVTISTLSAGVISGPGFVCIGSPITLTDAVSGGVWSAANADAVVSGGFVSGLTAGLDTISYTVTNACGASTTTQLVTVIAAPDAGSITGPSSACTGTTAPYTDAATGGVWSSSNTSASISGAGVLTPLLAGETDTVVYTVSNACGTAVAQQAVSISASPSAGSISGGGTICAGASLTLADGIGGGVWSSGDDLVATVGSASGLVSGIGPGPVLISYSVANACGAAIATASVVVNPLPDAGTISGPSEVCMGAAITLSDAAAGGVWSAGNANATVSGGMVSGITPGTDPISYTVINSCGTASAMLTVTINTFPTVDSVLGLSDVCTGGSITLTDVTTGGTWSSLNAAASVSGGVVTGVSTGIDTIVYNVSNACATVAAIKIVTISSAPFAGSITGASSVCAGASTTLSDIVTGGVWSGSDAAAAVSGGVVTGIGAGNDTISYTIANGCGAATATKVIAVMPLPSAGSITGASSLCPGTSTTLTEHVSGGEWSSANSLVATVAGGVVTAISSGSVSISYTVTNACGSATAIDVVTVLTPGECTSGVKAVAGEGAEQLKVYPNPSGGTFTLDMLSDNNEPVHVIITTVAGEKVQEFTTVTNTQTAVTMAQAAGTYLLSATTEHGNYIVKITIE